jgi:catechol 2,3-dioxygenase-like lactoylglutathione lyase family enzyme
VEEGEIVSSHFGVCVSDMAKSRRFYVEGLGFELGSYGESGATAEDPQIAKLVGMNGEVAFGGQFLTKGAVRIELIHFQKPEPFGPTTARAMNQLGLTHMSFRVKDMDAVIERLAKLGGSFLADTRGVVPFSEEVMGEVAFCTDPDGTRIELMMVSDDFQFDAK